MLRFVVELMQLVWELHASHELKQDHLMVQEYLVQMVHVCQVPQVLFEL